MSYAAYNHEQKVALRALAITASSLSIIAGSFMIYWFAKLRRKTFRHQLVMMLITSDFLKACAELIYPAATITNGSTKSGALCTATGFVSTIFVSSTDAAVLFIALHTALSIFLPASDRSSEKSGLYPYRHIMYCSWIGYSLLLPSLAFLNKNTAYTSSVSWCFLPIRPFYWRIALSWAPRYVILLFILVLYLSIYIYVTQKFKSFSTIFAQSAIDEDSQEGMGSISNYSLQEHPRFDPKVAELATHDLVESDQVTPESARDTSPATQSTSVDSLNPQGRKASVISISLPPELEYRRASVMSLGKGLGTFTRITRGSSDSSPNISIHKLPPSRPADPLRDQRRLIVKQLKHLFIFPIVYFFMWIIPFAFHMTQYHDKFVSRPVFALSACASFIIPIHGLVDVVVYARAERPWRSWRFNASRRRNTEVDEIGRRRMEELEEAKARRGQMKGKSEWWDLDESSEV